MSDARWFEVDRDVMSAVRHFSSAERIWERRAPTGDQLDAYVREMALMHAMQSGHTSLESALVRILGLLHEAVPTGERWHANLIERVASELKDRPAILPPAVAAAAKVTRRFRHVAASSYDAFEEDRTELAITAARILAADLGTDIAAFRAAIDP